MPDRPPANPTRSGALVGRTTWFIHQASSSMAQTFLGNRAERSALLYSTSSVTAPAVTSIFESSENLNVYLTERPAPFSLISLSVAPWEAFDRTRSSRQKKIILA